MIALIICSTDAYLIYIVKWSRDLSARNSLLWFSGCVLLTTKATKVGIPQHTISIRMLLNIVPVHAETTSQILMPRGTWTYQY